MSFWIFKLENWLLEGKTRGM